MILVYAHCKVPANDPKINWAENEIRREISIPLNSLDISDERYSANPYFMQINFQITLMKAPWSNVTYNWEAELEFHHTNVQKKKARIQC